MPYDSIADTLLPEAKKHYLGADKEYFSGTNKHLNINGENARRSVQRQAQMYKDKFLRNIGYGTDKPGYSIHNYGIAIDLDFNGHDVEIIVGIMEKHGWKRTVYDRSGKEPWHFDCIASHAYQDAVRHRGRISNNIVKWWDAVQKCFHGEKAYQDELSQIEQLRAQHDQQSARLKEAARKVDEWKSQLIEKEKLLSEKIEEFNKMTTTIKELVNEYTPLAREHDTKVSEYNRIVLEAQHLIDKLNEVRQRINDLVLQDNQYVDEYNELAQRYNNSRSSEEKRQLKGKIDALKKDINAGKERINSLEKEHDSLKVSLDIKIKQIKRLEHDINVFLKRLDPLDKQIKTLAESRDQLGGEIDTEQQAFDTKFKQWKIESENVQRGIEQWERDAQSLLERVSNLKKLKQTYQKAGKDEEHFLKEIEKSINEFVVAHSQEPIAEPIVMRTFHSDEDHVEEMEAYISEIPFSVSMPGITVVKATPFSLEIPTLVAREKTHQKELDSKNLLSRELCEKGEASIVNASTLFTRILEEDNVKPMPEEAMSISHS